jgi:hypothetical protein
MTALRLGLVVATAVITGVVVANSLAVNPNV